MLRFGRRTGSAAAAAVCIAAVAGGGPGGTDAAAAAPGPSRAAFEPAPRTVDAAARTVDGAARPAAAGLATATGATDATDATDQQRPIQPPPPFSPYPVDPGRRGIQERVLAAVVGIRARLPQPQITFRGKRKVTAEVSPAEGTGSGVVVDSSGLILTCAHVVGGVGKVRVFLADDREVEASVTVYDVTSDLALLKVDAGTLPALDLGGAAPIRAGQSVLLASRPGGSTIHFVEGVLSAPGVYHLGHSQLEFFRRFEGRIEPGDSGGALVGEDGSLVGIVSVGLVDGRTGYAITREFIQTALARLRMGPPVVWPWLGMAVEDTGQGGGARVWSVLHGSPAKAAGVRPGDVLVAIDGKPIDHFLTAMLRVAARPIGTRFDLGILDGGPAPGVGARAANNGAGKEAASSVAPASSVTGRSNAARVTPQGPPGSAPSGPGNIRAVAVLSGPRAIVPVLDPLDLFERETGIRLEAVPASEDAPGHLRAASVPPSEGGAPAPCRVGSRLVGMIPGLNLILALEEGRSGQEIRTTNIRELGSALRAAAVGDRVAAALIWDTAGHRATMFLSGDAKRHAIL